MTQALDKAKRRKANRQLRKLGESPVTNGKQRACAKKFGIIGSCIATIDSEFATPQEKLGARRKLKEFQTDWQNRGTANVTGAWDAKNGSKAVAIPLSENTFVFPSNFKPGK